MRDLKSGKYLKVSLPITLRDEEYAMQLHRALEDKKAEKILARYIWQGKNPKIILELADSIGIPKKWRVSVAKRMAVLGSGEQIVETLGWMGWRGWRSKQARDILVEKLLEKPPQEWVELVRKESSNTNSFLRPEEIAVLLQKAA